LPPPPPRHTIVKKNNMTIFFKDKPRPQARLITQLEKKIVGLVQDTTYNRKYDDMVLNNV